MTTKVFSWNEEKNTSLKQERGIAFEDVVEAIGLDCLLDIIVHPNVKKYLDQRVFVIAWNDYVYLVPFVENDSIIFLKTIIPSRKAVKKYLNR